MGKKIKKKYYSETAVKKALRIDSFRNLSKEKVMELSRMMGNYHVRFLGEGRTVMLFSYPTMPVWKCFIIRNLMESR